MLQWIQVHLGTTPEANVAVDAVGAVAITAGIEGETAKKDATAMRRNKCSNEKGSTSATAGVAAAAAATATTTTAQERAAAEQKHYLQYEQHS